MPARCRLALPSSRRRRRARAARQAQAAIAARRSVRRGSVAAGKLRRGGGRRPRLAVSGHRSRPTRPPAGWRGALGGQPREAATPPGLPGAAPCAACWRPRGRPRPAIGTWREYARLATNPLTATQHSLPSRPRPLTPALPSSSAGPIGSVCVWGGGEGQELPRVGTLQQGLPRLRIEQQHGYSECCWQGLRWHRGEGGVRGDRHVVLGIGPNAAAFTEAHAATSGGS